MNELKTSVLKLAKAPNTSDIKEQEDFLDSLYVRLKHNDESLGQCLNLDFHGIIIDLIDVFFFFVNSSKHSDMCRKIFQFN
jgi:hypothetical protein